MLSDAAEALQNQVKIIALHKTIKMHKCLTQELKHKERQDNLQSRLENERDRRMEAERDSEDLKHEVSELRENQKGEEKRISDESRFLYAEAFGSINLGIGGSAKSDSEVSCQKYYFT